MYNMDDYYVLVNQKNEPVVLNTSASGISAEINKRNYTAYTKNTAHDIAQSNGFNIKPLAWFWLHPDYSVYIN